MYQIPSQTASFFPLFLHLAQKDMVPEYRDTRFVALRVDRHLPSDWLQYHNFDNFGCNFWGLFWLVDNFGGNFGCNFVTFGIFWLYTLVWG